MNDGNDIDEDDNEASTITTDATTARTTSSTTTNSKRSSTTKQTTLNFNNKKVVTSTDDDDVDDKIDNNSGNNSRHNVPDNILQTNKRSYDATGDNTADRQRIFGSVVIDRERLMLPPPKRARGGDVEARGQRSWVHQAFSVDDGENKHQCQICNARLEPGGSGTSTRRKHYEAMHPKAFAELEATAAKGGNAAAFAKIVNGFKPKNPTTQTRAYIFD